MALPKSDSGALARAQKGQAHGLVNGFLSQCPIPELLQ
jgi:hypothetical protein